MADSFDAFLSERAASLILGMSNLRNVSWLEIVSLLEISLGLLSLRHGTPKAPLRENIATVSHGTSPKALFPARVHSDGMKFPTSIIRSTATILNQPLQNFSII